MKKEERDLYRESKNFLPRYTDGKIKIIHNWMVGMGVVLFYPAVFLLVRVIPKLYLEDMKRNVALLIFGFVLTILGMIYLYKQMYTAGYQFREAEILYVALVGTKIFTYDQLRAGIEKNGVTVREDCYLIQCGSHKIRFYFDLGNTAKVKKQILDCYKTVEKRTGIDLVSLTPKEITSLDTKYYYDCKRKTSSIVLFVTALGTYLVCRTSGVWFWILLFGCTIVQYVCLWQIAKALSYSKTNQKVMQVVVDKKENVHLQLKRTGYGKAIAAVVLAIFINYLSYTSILHYL